jgi:hypothetical protein
MTESKPFQFTLWSLVVVVTLCAVVCAVIKSLGGSAVAGFGGLAFSGILVLLLALVCVPLDATISRLPSWTSFVVGPALCGTVAFASYIFGEAIDQPHFPYSDDEWFLQAVVQGAVIGAVGLLLMIVIVAIDAATQQGQPRDCRYYPRLRNLKLGLRSLNVRLILIIGGFLIAAYYSTTVIEVWSPSRNLPCWLWPPKRIFLSCQLLWGLLWLADCSSRPGRGTVVAAIGFLVLSLLLVPIIGFGVLRQ